MHTRTFAALGLGCAIASLPAAAPAQPFRSAARAATPAPAASPAAPADAPAAALADSTGRRRFDIAAGALGDALADFARQADVRVTATDRAALRDARAAAVAGVFTPGEALTRLLAGTGLAGRFVDAATALVGPPAQVAAAARELRAVVVTGDAGRGYRVRNTMSATRTDTPLRDTPQAVTVVTRALIADQAMQSMADVVRYVPGVTMGQGEGHRDAPTIRGNASTADFFVDGVRDDAQYLRDLYNVERVEGLKGANAMVFGRGGGGGVLNRVSKQAEWVAARALTVSGGSYDHRRAAIDVGQPLGGAVAVRLNGVYENSGGFRDAASLERWGVNPTLAIAAGARTTVRLGVEHFNDARVVDRGLPSFRGRPSDADITTFFGDPAISPSRARVDAATASVEHARPGGALLRNRTRFTQYDKSYQNVFPGALNAAGTQVTLSAYGTTTDRTNLFNQSDVTYETRTGGVRHTLLAGAELGRQATSNVRQTGYFDNTATSVAVAFDAPTVSRPVTFRQSATDADNRVTTTVASVFAQDQVALTRHLQAIVGVRYERVGIRFRNDRNGDVLERDDAMLSPRAGLVLKPAEPVSLYGSYSLSFLPSAGDQFSSLTATTSTLEPERFTNRELGAKWDVRPDLALSAAVFRLDRTNTSATDPTDPTRTVQTGSQRTRGWELGLTGNVTGAWQVAGGYASQRAEITSATSAAKAGTTVPLVPRHQVSLWNRYQLRPALGLGLGVVHQADMFAAIDNTVTLPGFTRVDAAAFFALTSQVRAQVNVENLLDRRYYGTSHGNNNIMPGAPRTVRVSLSTGL
jgi:catecholate siderophore receptor